MGGRERFRAWARFEAADRPLYWEFAGVEAATLTRWHREGLPTDVYPEVYFGFDRVDTVPIDDGLMPPYGEEVLGFENAVVTCRDALGRVCRRRAGRVIEVVSYPLTTPADLADVLTRLNPRSPRRFPAYWASYLRCAGGRDHPLGLDLRGPLGRLIDLAGVTWVAALLDEDPDLANRALEAFTSFTIDLARPVLAGVADLDFVILREALPGAVLSARTFEDLLAARYERLLRPMQDHGVAAVILACPGDVRAVTGRLIEVGVTALMVSSPMDPVALRREHGRRLALIGGLDATTLTRGHEATEAEVMGKAPLLLDTGGWVPSLDRPVPHEVSLEHYRYYLEVVRDLVEAR